jgi:hypothetical protein
MQTLYLVPVAVEVARKKELKRSKRDKITFLLNGAM